MEDSNDSWKSLQADEKSQLTYIARKLFQATKLYRPESNEKNVIKMQRRNELNH